MKPRRPLTWLFVLATICVDLALVLGASGDQRIPASEGLAFFIYNYGLPAQMSALAIWAVLSPVHRLTKGAWLTLAGGLLLGMTWWVIESQYRGELVAFCFLQLVFVLVGVGVLRWLGWVAPLAAPSSDPSERFQFSLVEMFGWSIIVAFWSFAVRFADFAILQDGMWWIWLAWACFRCCWRVSSSKTSPPGPGSCD